MTVALNTTYRIKIEAVGSSIKVFVDDMSTPKISVTDTSHTTGANGLRPLAGAELFNPGGTLSSTANNKNVILSVANTLRGDAMVNSINLNGFGLNPKADTP